MSIGTRLGSVLLLSGLAWMSSAPARAETSGWTDPPAREAAPDKPVAAKPEPKPASEAKAPEAAQASRAKAAPHREAAIRPRGKGVAAMRRRTAAASRRGTVPARSRMVAEEAAPPVPRRVAVHRAKRNVVGARSFDPYRTPRFVGRAYPAPERRAGWGGLLGEDRARRIARAEAAGYLVMRARDVVYPDGRIVRTLHPLGPMGEGGYD